MATSLTGWRAGVRWVKSRGAHVAGKVAERAGGTAARRLRLAACCLGLTALVFTTSAGRIVANTKLDLAVDPASFLAAALHLWDPSSSFGQLRNQSYGYLFPMGPFFWLADAAGLPGWVTQRLWMSLVLCVAFLGAERLAHRFGVGSPATRLVTGLTYALAPRLLELIAANSSEIWPSAVLPWILLPLVRGARQGSPRAAAGRSGLAVAACGGINGAAVVAVLAVPLVYLLTRTGGARRRRLLFWWLVAVAAATLWWLVPLGLLAVYGFSFLPYTETAAATTSTTSLVNVLRGTANWVGFLFIDGFPWLPAGWKLSTEAAFIVLTGLVAALGLTGLALRDVPERRFLVLCLLLGAASVGAGHANALTTPLAGTVQQVINEWLAPLRNLHKFGALVRLPLALGIGHLLATGLARRPARRPAPGPSPRPGTGQAPNTPPTYGTALTVLTVLALLATLTPAFTAGLAPRGDFRNIPRYWHQATQWLDQHAGRHTTLVVPGAEFGEYTWGRPMDEPMQPLMDSSWASWSLVPDGSPGLARLMAAIDRRFTTGRGSPGLADVLARMGVRYLLVRNDLNRARLHGAWPARVHEAIAESPGLRKVTEFGPRIGYVTQAGAPGVDQPYPALEVYEVGGAAPRAVTTPASATLRVFGGPEALLDLADAGLLDGRPVIMAGDEGAQRASGTVVTGTLRRRELAFGRLRNRASPTMTATEPHSSERPVHDILDPAWRRSMSVARLHGAETITASSSASNVDALGDLPGTGYLPYAALDGDLRTTWVSGGYGGAAGQWLRVDFGRTLDPRGAKIAFVDNNLLGGPPTRVAVDTASGTLVQSVQPTPEVQRLRVPAGPSSWLRVRVLATSGLHDDERGTRVGIAELAVPGVGAERTIVLPHPERGDASGAAPSVVMSRSRGYGSGCVRGSQRWVCSVQLARPGEDGNGFDRTFPAPRPGPREISGTAVLRDPGRLAELVRGDRLPVTASSTWSDHPAGMPWSAYDGDPETVWTARPQDTNPSLRLRWDGTTKIDHLRVKRPPWDLGTPPLRVRVTGDDGETRRGLLGKNGRIEFAPMETDELSVAFTALQPPLEIAEVKVPGVAPPPRPDPSRDIELDCGEGPDLRLNGTVLKTRARGTVGDLLAGRPLRFSACGEARVRAGGNRLMVPPSASYRIASVTVAAPPDGGAGDSRARSTVHGPEPAGIVQWGPRVRRVEVDARQRRYLVINENFNPGWRATVSGEPLKAVRLDGWRQAWVIPAGTHATVTLTFTPDRAYRIALGSGFLLALGLVPMALITRRRKYPPAAPPAGGDIRAIPAIMAAPLLGMWLGGPAGAAACLAGVVVAARCPAWLAGTGMVVAAGSYALGWSLANAGMRELGEWLAEVPTQLACLLVLGLLLGRLANLPAHRWLGWPKM